MIVSTRRPMIAGLATWTLAFAVVLACAQEVSAPVASDLDVRAAKGGPGAAEVKVSSAVPDSAARNTTLDVVINGSGFEAGMQATWKLQGVANPEQVRTNSTLYVSSRQVVANITISADAVLAKWDIEVMGKGKGGIGTEMFEVKATGNVDTDTRQNIVFDDVVNVAAPLATPMWEPARITGDFRDRTGAPLSDGSSGEYQGDFCGYVTLVNNLDGTITVEPIRSYYAPTMDTACGGPRQYQFFFAGRAQAPLRSGIWHRVYELREFAVGESRLQGLSFGIQNPGCTGLHFNSDYSPASSARVTRLADAASSSGTVMRWRVESQGNHRAMCTNPGKRGPVPTGVHHYMPFAFTVTEVPYPFPRFP